MLVMIDTIYVYFTCVLQILMNTYMIVIISKDSYDVLVIGWGLVSEDNRPIVWRAKVILFSEKIIRCTQKAWYRTRNVSGNQGMEHLTRDNQGKEYLIRDNQGNCKLIKKISGKHNFIC